MVKRYLITGVAGSGKSTLERRFRDDGYITIDIDDGYAEWRHAETDEPLAYSPDESGWHEVAEWTVRTDKLQAFFDVHAAESVYVFGSFARMKSVVSMFDVIILLRYPDEATARKRIAERKDGYGKHPGELARILSYIQPYQEGMLQHGAIAVNCTQSIDQVADVIRRA